MTAMNFRRGGHLHQNPEIAYEEKDTSDFVAAIEFWYQVHRGRAAPVLWG